MVFQNKTTREYAHNAGGDASILSSSDLGATTALVTAGYSIVRINKQNPRKAEFVFLRDREIEEALEAYWSNGLTVPARAYFDNLKMLKSRLYED